MRFVYFVESAGLVKVGLAGDPSARLAQLQTGSPTKLSLLGYMPGSAKSEMQIHDRCAHLWSHGEWFHRGHPLDWYIECGMTFMVESGLERLTRSLPVNPIEDVLDQFDNLPISESSPTDF